MKNYGPQYYNMHLFLIILSKSYKHFVVIINYYLSYDYKHISIHGSLFFYYILLGLTLETEILR